MWWPQDWEVALPHVQPFRGEVTVSTQLPPHCDTHGSRTKRPPPIYIQDTTSAVRPPPTDSKTHSNCSLCRCKNCCIHSCEPHKSSQHASSATGSALPATAATLTPPTNCRAAERCSNGAPAHEESNSALQAATAVAALECFSGAARAAVLFSTAPRGPSALDLRCSGLCAQLAGGNDEVATDQQQHQHQTSPAAGTHNEQQQEYLV